jgi:DNA-binding MarR family transcriptional regulator
MTTPKKHRSPAAEFDLSASPVHLLRRGQQRALDIFNREVGASGLTPRQFVVLHAVQEEDGLTQTDLVRRTNIDRSTLADMISRLTKRDLLSRTRTAHDQRANAVSITPAGQKALRAALSRIRSAEERLLAPLPPSKRTVFLESLRLLASAEEGRANGRAAPARNGSGRRTEHLATENAPADRMAAVAPAAKIKRTKKAALAEGKAGKKRGKNKKKSAGAASAE